MTVYSQTKFFYLTLSFQIVFPRNSNVKHPAKWLIDIVSDPELKRNLKMNLDIFTRLGRYIHKRGISEESNLYFYLNHTCKINSKRKGGQRKRGIT